MLRKSAKQELLFNRKPDIYSETGIAGVAIGILRGEIRKIMQGAIIILERSRFDYNRQSKMEK